MGFDQEHIVMLPFMAQGHLIPFLALANQIQHRTGFTITIATTPTNLNAQYLRSAISSNTLSAQPNNNIHLAELPFPSQDYGLPPNTESTENLPLNLIGNLFTASQYLEAPTRRLVSDITKQQGKPPLCLISDVFFGWAVNVANSSGTVNVAFSTGGAYGTAAYATIWLHLPHRNRNVSSDDEEFQLPGFPERLSFETLSPASVSKSRGRKKYSVKKSGISAEKCNEWLDSHASDSVVYISFGSQNTISASQMMELARAGDTVTHPATSAFVSHCGWNSVVESLSQGVPIIGWPLAAEQAYNSKMLVEEMGVSVELTRGVQSNVVAEEVRRVIDLVVDESGKGGEMRRRAGEIKDKIRGAVGEDGEATGSSAKAIDDFVFCSFVTHTS
ncbi:hypothetical protein M0R45_019924 [Rubus argutus]|uniref:Glycosyltransferase N-terminal domain-containing protein n=1 Tax=Rubus argutus TaxID=59490 RepID=A0AAW1X980_RUBAR